MMAEGGLRVAVDARPLDIEFLRSQGIGRFTASLLRELVPLAEEREGELTILRYEAGTDTEGPHARTVRVRRPRVPSRLADFPEQVLLPLDLRRSGAQVHHALSIYRTALYPGLPTVMTLYDLIPLMWPDQYLRTGLVHRMLFRAARRATRLLAISESARRDAIAHLGVEPERIAVAPAAVGAQFAPRDPGPALERYGVTRPYLLYVGGLANDDPRKNVGELIAAFSQWTRERGRKESLVLAGKLGPASEPLRERAVRAGAPILFTDYVPDEDLAALYSGATCFVTASRYEGFGLPSLEALACGTPVAAYDVGPAGEVAGPGALLVADGRPEDLFAAVERIAGDAELRKRLSAAGREHSRQFSWRRTAELTWDAYEEARAA
jgi:glycosyltransferase involved in cell wall biosynthesis